MHCVAGYFEREMLADKLEAVELLTIPRTPDAGDLVDVEVGLEGWGGRPMSDGVGVQVKVRLVEVGGGRVEGQTRGCYS